MAQTGTKADIRDMLEHIEATEVERLKTAFTAILLEHTDLEVEDIYSLVFNGGRRIIWS